MRDPIPQLKAPQEFSLEEQDVSVLLLVCLGQLCVQQKVRLGLAMLQFVIPNTVFVN